MGKCVAVREREEDWGGSVKKVEGGTAEDAGRTWP